MKIRRFFLLLTLISGFVFDPRVQGEPLTLEPPLSEAFPVAIQAGGARVPYPILLNDHTILNPDAVLRFIYIDPNAGIRQGSDGGSGLSDGPPVTHSHVGPGGSVAQDPEPGKVDGPAGAWGSNGGDPDAGIFDDNKKDDSRRKKSELQSEVWQQKDLFTDALAHATELGTTVVYLSPGQTKPATAVFDLPEGMLLAQVGGHVRVLGLSPDSRAYAGGVRAGDEIRALGAAASLITLGDFERAYIATKRQARISGNPTYSMQIWRPDEGRLVPIQVAAPPSIPSFF